MLEMNFKGFENKENVELLQGYYEKYRHLVPHWVKELTCYLSAPQGGATIDCKGDYRYRMFRIFFSNEFFTASPKYTEDAFVHELCHMYSAYMSEHIHEVILPQIQDEALQEVLREEYKNRLEIGTEDLKIMLMEATHAIHTIS